MTSKKMAEQTKAKAKKSTVREPEIDWKFKELIIPLTMEEYARLEQNLLAAGRCRDPLVVWKGHNTLLDGHNRLEICKKHNLSYNVVEIELSDQEAAFAWIRDNQLGRRNLSQEAVSYLRGQQYNAEKKSHGGDRKSEGSSGNACHLKTDQELAERYKVAPKTIRNDGDFAEALDKITGNCGDDFKTALLRREVKLNRPQVQELAEMDKEKQRKEVSQVLSAGMIFTRHDSNGKKVGAGALDKITVPTEPEGLAQMLLLRLGPSMVARVLEAITKVLEEHHKKQQEQQDEGKPKRRGKAATSAA